MKKNENIETIKNEKFLISSLDKKIKAISNYKADDIKIIAKKLGIEIMKSSNKTFTKKNYMRKLYKKFLKLKLINIYKIISFFIYINV